MKKSDIESGRTAGTPEKSVSLMKGKMKNQGYTINGIELRQYVERKDERLGEYSLLTVVVETDRGSVEMKYDEGFRGPDALESAASMLTQYVGLASLINRALIELER
ncbi:MAG: hypothetical protein MN733_04380 [Nitrososphaera sp.]|nr:hypothetical protein [Nitrososphaera sp.]